MDLPWYWTIKHNSKTGSRILCSKCHMFEVSSRNWKPTVRAVLTHSFTDHRTAILYHGKLQFETPSRMSEYNCRVESKEVTRIKSFDDEILMDYRVV